MTLDFYTMLVLFIQTIFNHEYWDIVIIIMYGHISLTKMCILSTKSASTRSTNQDSSSILKLAGLRWLCLVFN